ncbi:RHS repeat-associated core domain-containing protein [Kribbella sp. NPDC004536]|uniref:RHS repeat-associated core domain-containing protein n=1 Tax=Kribbella sp. NPDC004536 TaxID=3364106 RepID=UPI00367F4FBF
MRKHFYRRTIAAALAVVLTTVSAHVPVADASRAHGGGKTATPAQVSNAFAMGGGIGGQIDQRTGAFQASVPLLNLAGRGGSDLSMSLSYDQNLATQGAAGNRFGFGSGWALGLPWVNTVGQVRVFAASGGSYTYDTGSPTGLHHYAQRDLLFARTSGSLPDRTGVPQGRTYAYTLKHYDGTTDYFDASGNLIEQADRFGNLIDLTWKQSGQMWQPTAAIDNYGNVTTFDYSTPGSVKVTAPVNAEGIAASTTLKVGGGVLQNVTDAAGAVTSFQYQPVPGTSSQLLHGVVTPSGAHTTVSYAALTAQPNVVMVTNVQVTDGVDAVQTTRTFTANPAGNGGHNYTGYPNYDQAGPDGLFDSNDQNYLYQTVLSDGRSSVTETYNSLDLLKSRVIRVKDPARGMVVARTQNYTYPAVSNVQNLPANFAKPTTVSVVYGDRTWGPTRTSASSSSFNDRGELTSQIDETGAVTTTTYDPAFGVPTLETTTGTDGTKSVTTNTLTPDGKAVRTSTTAVGSTGQTPTARTVTSYSYNPLGEINGRSVTWAPGAKPSGPSGGPDQVDTSRTIAVDVAAHTRTVVETTAAGTAAAAATTTVTDLITGNVLTTTDPDQLTTKYTHDALGRVTSSTAPGNRTTATSYPSPLITVVTDPAGHITRTTTDVLGRTVKVTDNVSGQKLVADPTARTVTVNTYSVDGATATSTPTTGATTTTSYDQLQRPVKVVKPDGLTQVISYDDVAHTKTTSVLPIGAQSASSVTVERFDDLDRTVASGTTYTDNTPQTTIARSYDGLGRVVSTAGNDVAAALSYNGAGGLQDNVTLTPTNPTAFPGGTEVGSTGNTLTGAVSTKTLTDKAATGPTTTTGATLTYDAAGRVVTATDLGGGTISYTYTPGGKVKTVTSPTGTVTTNTYSPTTGELVEKVLQGADGTTQKIGYTYDPVSGRLTSVLDADHPADVVSYSYDADGHTTAVRYPDGTSSLASYQDDGKLATTTDVTGTVTTYRYTPAGLTTGATQVRNGAQVATVDYGYDSHDRIETIDRGNGVVTTIGYNDASRITSQTTKDGATVLRDDDYSYDAHGNTTAHTTTTGTTTSTSSYSYDAYDRLISSAVYPNASGSGTPSSTSKYVLDAGGNVTQLTTTANGVTSTTANTITSGDRLTARTVDGTTVNQTFQPDGAVHQDLDGATYQYNLSGKPVSATAPDGTTTGYTYWPDGTRRSATTTVDGVTHTTTLHYDTTGQVANDTYTDSTAGSTAQTASYLFGVDREARSLTAGSVVGAPPPSCPKAHRACPKPPKPCHPQKKCPTPGPGPVGADAPGTQYYLADAHGSMVGMTDGTGAVAATYRYGDYGQPVGANPAALAKPAATAAGNAAVNPFTYNSVYTDPSTGTQVLPARTYDPAQGRFLSLDSADMLNRYQAFDTNPVNNTDPSGHVTVPDVATDSLAAGLFLLFGILSLIPFVDVITGPLAIGELGAAAAIGFVANGVTAATNLGAFALSTTLAADDGYKMTKGEGFLSKQQREDVSFANTVLGTTAGIFGGVAGGAGIAAGKEVEEELATASKSLEDTQTNLAASEADRTAAQRALQTETSDKVEAIRQRDLALNGVAAKQNELEDIQGERDIVTARLAATEGALDTAFERLGTANGRLDAVTAERDAAQTQLTQAQKEITDLKETALQVANAAARLALPAENIEKVVTAPDPNAGLNQVSPLQPLVKSPIRAFRGFNGSTSWEAPW